MRMLAFQQSQELLNREGNRIGLQNLGSWFVCSIQTNALLTFVIHSGLQNKSSSL